MTRWPDAIGSRLSRPGSPTHLALVRIAFGLHVLTVLVSPSLALIAELDARPLFLTLSRWCVLRTLDELLG